MALRQKNEETTFATIVLHITRTLQMSFAVQCFGLVWENSVKRKGDFLSPFFTIIVRMISLLSSTQELRSLAFIFIYSNKF